MKEEIENKLNQLKKYVGELRKLKGLTWSEFTKDNVKRAAVERFFQMAIEVVIDISSMIISCENFEKPDDYRSIILKLGKSGVLDENFAEEFADIAGFRNVLVHQYAKIDTKIVHRKLEENLEDFDEFAKQIATYLKEKED